MDFAPYQSSPPEHSRVASPENAASPRHSYEARRPFSPVKSPPPLQHPQPHRGWTGFDGQGSSWAAGGADNRVFAAPNPMPGAYPAEVSEFDTSLGMRLDYEACLAYLVFPPLGAIILLILERNSDYVRFHAWQSALLFTAIMVFHLILSWSTFLSWVFFIADMALIAFLALRAYRDAEILDRFEVPFFGRIASHILDDE
ncbi:Fc.00g070300.m01.CDS01 [Cosmosporella sp. VM-42]